MIHDESEIHYCGPLCNVVTETSALFGTKTNLYTGIPGPPGIALIYKCIGDQDAF